MVDRFGRIASICLNIHRIPESLECPCRTSHGGRLQLKAGIAPAPRKLLVCSEQNKTFVSLSHPRFSPLAPHNRRSEPQPLGPSSTPASRPPIPAAAPPQKGKQKHNPGARPTKSLPPTIPQTPPAAPPWPIAPIVEHLHSRFLPSDLHMPFPNPRELTPTHPRSPTETKLVPPPQFRTFSFPQPPRMSMESAGTWRGAPVVLVAHRGEGRAALQARNPVPGSAVLGPA